LDCVLRKRKRSWGLTKASMVKRHITYKGGIRVWGVGVGEFTELLTSNP